MSAPEVTYRSDVRAEDAMTVRCIVDSTSFFNPEEVAVAEELVLERLAKGPASGYEFVFADVEGRTVGYACYGHILGTESSHDLYWIAVESTAQSRGLGSRILIEAERRIRLGGGDGVYVETSSRAQYAPTRAFYERRGYAIVAVLPAFYAPDDDKVVYCKRLRVGEAA